MIPFAKFLPASLLGACCSMALLLAPVSAMAASQCKGLAQQQCAGVASCLWVDGYKRSDGREVSGYCRAQRGAKAGKPSQALRTSKVD